MHFNGAAKQADDRIKILKLGRQSAVTSTYLLRLGGLPQHADALKMLTIDLYGMCGWLPTRACTRLVRGGLVSLTCSMATQLGTPWRGTTGQLHSRGCPGNGHDRSLWHSRVVATPRMHAVEAGWTFVAQ